MVETGAVETGAVETGAVETGAVETGAVETDAVKRMQTDLHFTQHGRFCLCVSSQRARCIESACVDTRPIL
jgi:hypothetical protein